MHNLASVSLSHFPSMYMHNVDVIQSKEVGEHSFLPNWLNVDKPELIKYIILPLIV